MSRSLQRGAWHSVLCTTALAAAIGIGLADVARAQDVGAAHTFHITAGSLDGALREFATQSGLQMMYDPALVSGRRAAAFDGSGSNKDVLNKLLTGSDLHYQFTDAGTVVLSRAAAKPAPEKGAPTPVEKKDEVQRLEHVTVTGSKIKGVDIENAMPITTVTRKDIERLGVSTVVDVINSLPAAAVGVNRQSIYTQEAYANLRGLSAGYTLVLVNGHRWPGGASIDGNVDINTIPLAAVDHIDVMLDGGSVLYGSDAMVGVINIILRDRYDGVEVSLNYGQYGEGSGASKSFHFVGGHAGERYSLLGGVAYTDIQNIPLSDYPTTTTPLWGSGTSLYSDTTPAGVFQLCSIPGNTGVCPASSRVKPDGSTGSFTYAQGQGGTNWTTYSRSAYGYNNIYGRYLATPLRVKSAFGQFVYDITDDIKFKVLGDWTQTLSQRMLNYVGLDIGTGGAPGSAGAVTVAANNYYNPYGQQVATAHRLLTEGGMQGNSYTGRTTVLTPTLEGHFGAFGRDFDWEIGTVQGKTSATNRFFNQYSIGRIQNALGPSFKDTNGNIVCGTPGNVIAGCVPLNVFGQNSITPDMLNYIEYGRFAPAPTAANVMYLHNTFAQISSANLFELPAGDLGFSAGLERNSNAGYTYSYGPFITKDVLGQNRGIAYGDVVNNDGYLEFHIPLLKDLPFVQQLDLDAAGRESRYSFGANAFNKQYNIKWKANDDLALRASYSTAFHYSIASSISYPQTTYGVITDGSGTALDPCSFTTNTNGAVTSNRYAQLNTTQQAACQAHGVPAGGYDTTLAPVTTIVSGGNALIQPERDRYATWGFVYSPSYVPGFDIAVDWWNVYFSKQIITYSTVQMMQNCLNNYGAPGACPASWFERGTGGHLAYFRNSPINGRDGNRDRGVDVNLGYHIDDTELGNFRFKWANAIFLANSSPVTTIPNQNYVGTMAGSSGGGPFWRFRSSLQTEWNKDSWGATWTVRYFSSLKEQCTLVGSVNVGLCNDLGPVQSGDPSNPAGEKFLPFMQGGSANRLGAATYHDATAYWKAPWGGRFTVGVNNIFNKQPPYSVTSGSASFNRNYGIPDRYFFVAYSQKFL